MRFLSSPWAYTDCLICADSYFASVTTVEELAKLGLRLIGVVKTATKNFLLVYLNSIELKVRVDCKILDTLNDDTQRDDMVSVLWVDKKLLLFRWQ